jgi:hypothetical protein
MGYLGNTPGESFISFAKQVFTIVNSQTAYTLNFAVVDENELRLVINNVVQEPGSGKAYTASGTTLTLASALTNGTDEMYCVFLGKARETVTVPTITKDKLNLISTSSSAGLEVKGDGTTDGTIQLNCSQNTHGIKLASPPHSAGQSYTLTFPQSISADTFLKTDGSGNLSFAAAGGANTPAFMATLSSDFTCPDQATTRVQFDTETYDIGNCFDSTSTVGRFTVPTGEGGKYFFSAQLMIAASGSVVHRSDTMLYKNGSEVAVNTGFDSNNTQFNVFAHINIPLVLSAGDYIDVYNYNDVSSGTPSAKKGSFGNKSFFSGYKIIE